MDEQQHECGHTDTDHLEMRELLHLVQHAQKIENPRVAVVVTDSGEVHFASAIPPHEAAAALRKLAERVQRYGSNYVRDHFDRGEAARWN